MTISYQDKVYVWTYILMQFTIFANALLWLIYVWCNSLLHFFSKLYTFFNLHFFFTFRFNLHFDITLLFCHFIFVCISIWFTFKEFTLQIFLSIYLYYNFTFYSNLIIFICFKKHLYYKKTKKFIENYFSDIDKKNNFDL